MNCLNSKVFASWCVDRFGVRTIWQITPRMFKAFIREAGRNAA